MKLTLYWFPTSKEAWFNEVIANYEKKISFYQPFVVEALKVKKAGREAAEQKRDFEEKLLLTKIKPTDYVVVFDEKAGIPKCSLEFSKNLVTALESSKQRLVFIIGGAFGLGSEVKDRANLQLSFSYLTLSHQVALTVALEQIYRGLTIWKGHPYHNE